MAEERQKYGTCVAQGLARVLVVDVEGGFHADVLDASMSALAFTGFHAMLVDVTGADDAEAALMAACKVLVRWADLACPVAFVIEDAGAPAFQSMLDRVAKAGVVAWRFSARQQAMDFAQREGRLWVETGLQPSPLRCVQEPALSAHRRGSVRGQARERLDAWRD